MVLDPRWLIAKDTGYADHELQGDCHAVILELPDDAALDRNAALRRLSGALGAEGVIQDAFHAAPTDLRVATGWATAKGLDLLAALAKAGKRLKRFEYAQHLKPPRLRPVSPLLERAPAVAEDVEPPVTKGRARKLFVVIDHGCPFMHPLLRCAAGDGRPSSRVRALWDQQPGWPVQGALAPQGFLYGTELSRAQLVQAWRDNGEDEARAYRALGLDALRLRESHGAHALGMLLDNRLPRRQRGRHRPEGDVLFVQLPCTLLGAPSRAVLSRCLIDALVWVERQRQPSERVILSLGEGSSLGPHDGSSMVEQALQAFTGWPLAAAKPGRNRVYIAAGNGQDERLHAQFKPAPNQPQSLLWRLPPASELPATLELWLPRGVDGQWADLQVEVFAPGGQAVGALQALPPDHGQHWPSQAKPVLSMAASGWEGRDCRLSLIRLAPTAATAAPARAASGDWRVQLSTTAPLAGDVHAYIGRIKPALGFPLRTAQSSFVPTTGQAGLVGPTGRGTLQGLATAQGVLRAAGHVGMSRQAKMAPYSAQGPSRDGQIEQPDLQVRVDDGPLLQGRRSMGNRSGVSFRMNGTSVAAPLAARLDTKPAPVPKGAQRRAGGKGAAKIRKLRDGFDA